MGLRKTGSGQIIGEDQESTSKTASKNWDQKDAEELSQEMTESERQAGRHL